MVVEVDPETLFVIKGIPERVLEEKRAFHKTPNTRSSRAGAKGVVKSLLQP